METPVGLLRGLEDPRGANIVHRLGDLVVIAVASALCGGSTCVDFAQFASSKRSVLEKLLGPYAAPSHDTFSRVFRLLDPTEFARVFAQFAAGFAKSLEGVIAVDGKALRRAYKTGLATAPPLMVTAWAAQARVALAGVMPDASKKENELTAALDVLDLLDLKGTIVTADALHCTVSMAAKVIQRGGDYCLCLKGNRRVLKPAAEQLLAAAIKPDTAETQELSHGRMETRQLQIIPAQGFGADLGFQGVAAIAQITCQRGTASPKTRLYLMSRHLPAIDALSVIRTHWSIENKLHWSLDVIMNEDQLRTRNDNGPANLALITRAALNILNAIDDPKTPKRRRMLRCAWENDYLEAALAYMR
jgi:predicted transposase YbfD/YdcC